VEAYQRDRGLPVTGKLDGATWNGLLEQEGKS
jgi:peptidoglycan hydrolase-like protein with peptidoglycan-binding domain